MKNIRKKTVALAVASVVAGGAALMTVPAHAVNVSQNGLGQVQLFPYYTVKNGYDTYVHLTNTSSDTVLVKIRFRESLNSREVRDFNIILSPYDMWTASISAQGAGATVRTNDKTCTSPILPASSTASGFREIAFTSIGYDGTDLGYKYDNGGKGIDRVQEGYIEVISMARSFAAVTSSSNIIEYNAKHVSGTPRDCVKVDAEFAKMAGGLNNFGTSTAFGAFTTPENVVKGFSTLINVAQGKAMGVEPVHIENFTTRAIIAKPGDLAPDLTDGNVLDFLFLNNGAGEQGTAINSVDAVSAVLSATNVINEFTSNSAVGAATDWVVTFPTKHHYTDSTTAPTTIARDPFGRNFAGTLSTASALSITDGSNAAGQSCNDISITLTDREENRYTSNINDFSPRPTGSTEQICYEANIISFNNSNVLGGGINHKNVDTSNVGVNGWADLSFEATGNFTVGGLPVIGFAAITRNNASEVGNNRNYAVAEEHSKRSTGVND
jgi:hypothetical protein